MKTTLNVARGDINQGCRANFVKGNFTYKRTTSNTIETSLYNRNTLKLHLKHPWNSHETTSKIEQVFDIWNFLVLFSVTGSIMTFHFWHLTCNFWNITVDISPLTCSSPFVPLNLSLLSIFFPEYGSSLKLFDICNKAITDQNFVGP